MTRTKSEKNNSALAKVILIVMMLFISAISVRAEFPSAENLKITLINQDPDPADPGTDLKLKFRIENAGTKVAEDTQIELEPAYPFTLVPGEAAVKSIGSLEGLQTGTAGVTIEYNVKVDPSTSAGDHELKLKYQTKDTTWIEPSAFDIRVESANAFLSIEKAESDPQVIIPGQTAKLNFELKNMATTALKDIDITLDLSSDTTPFVPVDSSTAKKIIRIEAGETGLLTFDLTALPSAKSGTYKVPITVKYTDDLGNSYTKESIIGLKVGAEPDLSVLVDSTTITSPGTSGTITIKIVNKGLTDLKLMNAKIISTDEYDILGIEERYIGTLDSDDYETAEFKIEPKTKSGELTIKLKLEYMDANNIKYSDERSVPLKITESGNAGSGISIVGIVIVVLIVAAGLLIYRHNKKRKQK